MKKASTQVAILLHGADEGARIDKLHFSQVGHDEKENIKTVLGKFRSLCEPKKISSMILMCSYKEGNFLINI